MCGNACSYFVIRCDRCSEWYYISCHKLTEDAIKRLKDFFCNPCKSKDPKLHNTLKEHPTDKECDIRNHHAIHRFQGKQDPVRCICKPQCKTFCIGCEGCKRWCHMECISYTKEMADAVAKYYCPSCMDRNPELLIEYVQPRSSRSKLRQTGHSRKRAASSREDSAASGATTSSAMPTSTTEPFISAHRKRKKAVHKRPPRPAPNANADNVQEEQRSKNVVPINGGRASPATTRSQYPARSSTTPTTTYTAPCTTHAIGPAADTNRAETSGTSTARQNKKRQCICGSPCTYYVVKCDHCRAWCFASCHGLTKSAIKHLKTFYCMPCKRCNPKLTNTQKERPADKGVTFERRLCERENHHSVHRYLGKEDPLRCNHLAPCTDLAIECNKCKQWCHFECVRLGKDMSGKIAKFYCPPCVQDNPDLLIAYGSKQRHSKCSHSVPVASFTYIAAANSKRAAASADSNGPLAEAPDNGPAKKGKDALKRKRTTGNHTTEGVTVEVEHAPDEANNADEASINGDNEELLIKEEEEPDTRPGALDFVLLQARVRAIEGQLRGKDAELEKSKADNKRIAEERQRLKAELEASNAHYKRLSEDREKSEAALKRTIAAKDTELADLRRQHASTSTSSTHDAARIRELEKQLQLRDTCIARLTLAANGLA
ncbi:hypothetical protein AAVH_11873 [Aphelenchoides avenae]|nr:hypothetical protein AAVH_11873 [Aphelenchus avenae]